LRNSKSIYRTAKLLKRNGLRKASRNDTILSSST
jgi:hypothetical protein